METRVTRRIGDDGASRTAHFTAATLADALEAAMAELEAAGEDWEGWRIEGFRTIRGKRATLKLVFLSAAEVSRRKAERGGPADSGSPDP